jgi:DNA-binding IclR family transcriptional regulator
VADGLRGRGVLEGAFGLLEVLSRSAQGAGLSELARSAGLPKATAFRLLEQLVELGAVQRHERRYLVGRLLAHLGDAWQPHPGLQAAAREPVRLLSALTSTVAYVTVLHVDRVRVVTATRGVVTEVPRIQAYDEVSTSTAAGRVLLLADRGPAVDPPPGFTHPEWRQARAGFRRSGSVVVDHQEVMAGVCCVAVPVRRPDGEVVASVSALTLQQSLPAGLTELVLRASREITGNLA